MQKRSKIFVTKQISNEEWFFKFLLSNFPCSHWSYRVKNGVTNQILVTLKNVLLPWFSVSLEKLFAHFIAYWNYFCVQFVFLSGGKKKNKSLTLFNFQFWDPATVALFVSELQIQVDAHKHDERWIESAWIQPLRVSE